MADGSTIEWLDRPGTKPASWNPIRAQTRDPLIDETPARVGWHCEHVHEGCRNCYAERVNVDRFGTGFYYVAQNRYKVNVFLDEKTLLQPLHWKKPRTVFVCSMTDLYGSWVKDELLDRIYAVMALCPQHTFIVLTKRPERMREYLSESQTAARIKTSMLHLDNENVARWENGEVGLVNIDFERLGWTYLTGQPCHPGCKPPCEFMWCADGKTTLPTHLYDGPDSAVGGTCYGSAYWDGPLTLPNVWAGTSCSTQEDAHKFIPEVLATPLAKRIVSLEPLLGAIDLTRICLLPQKSGSIRAGIHINALVGRYCESGMPYTGAWDITKPAPDIPPIKLDWVIVGGESGAEARATPRSSYASLRDQCRSAGIAYFHKQNGEWIDADEWLNLIQNSGSRITIGDNVWAPHRPLNYSDALLLAKLTGRKRVEHHGDGSTLIRVGKKAAGRLLDGVEYNEFPR